MTLGRLINNLKQSSAEFQREATPENFARMVSAVGAFGTAFNETRNQIVSYSKKHPLSVALGASLIFFALRGLIGTRGLSGRDMTYH
jgi:hypothetical protein